MDAGAFAAIVKQRSPSLDLDLEALFAPGVAAIATRWPAAVIGPEFAADVAERLATHRDPASAAPRMHIDDLYLAWWAGKGAADGLAAFDAVFANEIDRIAARFRDIAAEELNQQLRIRLFVGADPKIRSYSGVGPLLAWLRVVAVRCFVDIVRASQSQRYHEELDEAELLGLPIKNELGASELGAELGATLKRAFAGAVARLAPRQRAFLRHAYVDRLTLDQIADTYSIHRATVARTLAAARAQLIEQTRAAVVEKLGVAPSELASALGTLDRRLELSLSRILRAS